jgi:hypothetical protein
MGYTDEELVGYEDTYDSVIRALMNEELLHSMTVGTQVTKTLRYVSKFPRNCLT